MSQLNALCVPENLKVSFPLRIYGHFYRDSSSVRGKGGAGGVSPLGSLGPGLALFFIAFPARLKGVTGRFDLKPRRTACRTMSVRADVAGCGPVGGLLDLTLQAPRLRLLPDVNRL